MDFKTEDIVECYSCGLFVEKINDNSVVKYNCPRCNTKLGGRKKHNLDSFYYSISAVLLFILLNVYPFLTLSFVDNYLQSTLIDTILIMYKQDFFLVATVVLFTIVIAPLLNSFVIILSFIQMNTKMKFFSETFLHDSFYFFKTWAFIEVFTISIIVTYIKLVGMISNTRFDTGFYILLIYLFCLYMANIKFESKNLFGE